MLDMPDWILFLVGQAFTAGSIYGAIRGDIKSALMKADYAHQSANQAHETANQAHNRINDILMKGR